MEKLSQEQCYAVGAEVAQNIINGMEKEARWKDYLPFTDKSPEYYDGDIAQIKAMLATKDKDGKLDTNHNWADEKALAGVALAGTGLALAGKFGRSPLAALAGASAGVGGLAGYAANKIIRYDANRRPETVKGYLGDLQNSRAKSVKRDAAK